MSRRIILSFILITSTLTLFSQNNQNNKSLHFGLTTGLHATKQIHKSKYNENRISQPSYSISGNIFYDFSRRIQFYSGLGIERMNVNTEDYTPTSPGDFLGEDNLIIRRTYFQNTFKGYYLMIPTMIKYKLSESKINNFYLAAGLRFKHLLNDNSETLLVIDYLGEDYTFMSLSKNLVDLSISIGHEFSLSKIKIFTEFNVYYTLNDIAVDEGNLSKPSKHLATGVNLGILF